ncbi:MAG: hypothetical protein IPO87_19170 [Flavobacteriales bacterium]|nr:hypothetical protein [Flavobacteriales bacterium]
MSGGIASILEHDEDPVSDKALNELARIHISVLVTISTVDPGGIYAADGLDQEAAALYGRIQLGCVVSGGRILHQSGARCCSATPL